MKLKIACVTLAATGMAFAGTWVKCGEKPVLGSPRLGTCFDVNVVTNGPAPYTMYFSWRPKKSIALVRSDDAMTWTEATAPGADVTFRLDAATEARYSLKADATGLRLMSKSLILIVR